MVGLCRFFFVLFVLFLPQTAASENSVTPEPSPFITDFQWVVTCQAS